MKTENKIKKIMRNKLPQTAIETASAHTMPERFTDAFSSRPEIVLSCMGIGWADAELE